MVADIEVKGICSALMQHIVLLSTIGFSPIAVIGFAYISGFGTVVQNLWCMLTFTIYGYLKWKRSSKYVFIEFRF